MAIQTHVFPHNLAFSFAASQDYCFMANPHNSNNNNNDLLFNFQHKQQYQHQQQRLVQFQDFHNPSLACYNGFVNNIRPATTTSLDQKPPLNFSHGFYDYSQEIDTHIASQNERLKVALQEETKKQMGEMWRKIEAKGVMIMQQKNQEIAKATDKRRELQVKMTKMEDEKEAWKRMALENESRVISLNKALEELKEENGYCYLKSTSLNGVDDAESWCDDKENEKKRDEMEMGIKCKVCKSGEASVVLLPCRHLSCCIACLASIHACPLCHSLKKASIQALFS